MLGIRTKLIIGFGGLLLIVLAMALLAEVILNNYSAANRRILREDLGSLTAIHQMRNDLDTVDKLLTGSSAKLTATQIDSIQQSVRDFDETLMILDQDATLPGETAPLRMVSVNWNRYKAACPPLLAAGLPLSHRHRLYLARLEPIHKAIVSPLHDIFEASSHDMLSAHDEAYTAARNAQWAMRVVAVVGGSITVIFAFLVGAGIHKPVRMLTANAEQIKAGNLDLTVPVESRDQIGRLAETFNQMTSQLRILRSEDRQRLARTLQTTQTAIDSLPDAVVVLNLLGAIEISNQTAKRVFSLEPGINIANLHDPALSSLLNHALGGHRVFQPQGYDAMIRAVDNGSERFFLPKAVAMIDPAGRPIGSVLTLTDVSGLHHLDEMKNNLLSMVSHELKNPLMSIRMIFPMLLEEKIGPLNVKQRELLAAGRDDGERLHHILQNLLDIARIESGGVLMETRSVSAADLIRWSVEPLIPAYRERGVELLLDLAASSPAVTADAIRISHVFANLLGNALKYTPRGGRVRVGYMTRGPWVEFFVTDNGQGIPAEYVGRIFEKFFRAPGQSGESGTGLGLAIVKGMVEGHGGRVNVESQEGKGTTFRFTLRRTSSDESAADQEPSLQEVVSVKPQESHA